MRAGGVGAGGGGVSRQQAREAIGTMDRPPLRSPSLLTFFCGCCLAELKFNFEIPTTEVWYTKKQTAVVSAVQVPEHEQAPPPPSS